MEVAIDLNIEILKAINKYINNIRNTPNLIQKLSLQSQQLSSLLGILHRKSQTHILGDADMEDWLKHQGICNKALRKIENLLQDYVRESRRGIPILDAAKFQFGPRKELAELMEELEKSVQYFISFSKMALSEAEVMQPPQRHDPQSSRAREPVMSLNQFVQMHRDSGEADL